MTFLGRVGILAVGLLALRSTAGAAPVSMSGTWELNVARSKWGNLPRPSNTRVQVTHTEPRLEWSGMVDYGSEAPREFRFSGAIDGKAYPQSRSYGEGMTTLRRVNDTTVESVWKSGDGRMIETVRMSVSPDAKTLTRVHTVKGPDGTESWTEVFEK